MLRDSRRAHGIRIYRGPWDRHRHRGCVQRLRIIGRGLIVLFGNRREFVGLRCSSLHPMVVSELGVAIEEKQVGVEQLAIATENPPRTKGGQAGENPQKQLHRDDIENESKMGPGRSHRSSLAGGNSSTTINAETAEPAEIFGILRFQRVPRRMSSQCVVSGFSRTCAKSSRARPKS